MRSRGARLLVAVVTMGISLTIPSGLFGIPERPEDVGEQPLIRVSVNLVQIDVVARDRKGRQVKDLRADEFEIRQDGREQKITHFGYIVSGSGSRGEPTMDRARPLLPPHRGWGLRREDVHRTIAVIVDDTTMRVEDVYWAQEAVTTFVRRRVQQGDLVAIATTSSGGGLLSQFVSDRRLLLAAAADIRYKLGNFSFYCGQDPG